MAKRNDTQKTERALSFLNALEQPHVAGVLAAYGLTEKEKRRGWTLFEAAARAPRRKPGRPKQARQNFRPLGYWFRKWLRVVEVTFSLRYRHVGEIVLAGLKSVRGPQTVVGARKLIERIERLEATDSVLGEQGRHARGMLRVRGLDARAIAEGRALAHACSGIIRAPKLGPSPEEIEAGQRAVAQLWRFYLEWSGIARAVVDDAFILHELGFSPAR